MYNIVQCVFKSFQYITLNLVLWNVTFKYWETSAQVVRIVDTLDKNLGATASFVNREEAILKC